MSSAQKLARATECQHLLIGPPRRPETPVERFADETRRRGAKEGP